MKIINLFFILSLLAVTNVFSSFTFSKEHPLNKDLLIGYDETCDSSYLRKDFLRRIKKDDIKLILEIGSRDAIDSIKLSNHFKCHVCAFECNPESISISEHNIKGNNNITLAKYAAWDSTGNISFFPVVKGIDTVNNVGASSCFKFDKDSEPYTKYVQSKITVEAIRLDEWLRNNNIANADMICMDAQGASLQVLKGMGDYLKNVKYIITELENILIYKDEILSFEVVAYLMKNGFEYVKGNFNIDFDDFLFIRKDIVEKEKIKCNKINKKTLKKINKFKKQY